MRLPPVFTLLLTGISFTLTACKTPPLQPISEHDKTPTNKQLTTPQNWEKSSARKITDGDYSGALQELLPIAQSEPKDYLVHYRLGLCYERLNQYDKAENAYSLAITLNPTANSYQRRANINILKQKPDKALQDLESAFQLKSQSPDFEFYNLRSHAFLSLGKDADAINNATLAAMENPRVVDPYRIRGGALLRSGQFFAAIKDLTEAIALDPTHAPTYYNRAMAYAKVSDFDAAYIDSEKAVTLDPKNAVFNSQHAILLGDKGRLQEALVCFNTACEFNPTPQNFGGRGLCYVKLGQNALAMADFNQAIALANEQDAASWFGFRGRLKSSVNPDPKEGLSDLNKAISLGTKDADIYDSAGVSYSRLKEWDNAIKNLNQAIALTPARALFYEHRAIVYANKGDQEKSLADFTKVIELSPKTAAGYNNRGYLLLALGNIDEAIKDFDSCIKLDPNFGLAYINRANAKLIKKDDIGAALDQAKGSSRPPGGSATTY